MPDVIKAVEENLGRVFRHILPGILIIGAGHASHPSWLRSVNFDSPWHLLTLGLLALAVGNTWYAVHRYGIEQFIDMVLTGFRRPGPAIPEKAKVWR